MIIFSLTDIVRYKNSEDPADVVKNWLRRKGTIEFIDLCEKLKMKPDIIILRYLLKNG